MSSPGPWKWSKHRSILWDDKTGSEILRLDPDDLPDKEDAKLIEAAWLIPDLVESLQFMLSIEKQFSGTPEEYFKKIDAARAVLAKAKEAGL